jgi:Bacterial Ig domain/Divergent InlB B-repeat domain
MKTKPHGLRKGVLVWFALVCAPLLFLPQSAVANFNLTIYAGNSVQQPTPVPTGVVTLQPSNHVWSSSSSAGQFSYPAGQVVTLLPTAPKGCSFTNWHENDSFTPYFGSDFPTNLYSTTMSSNRTFYATFYTNASGFFNLTVYKGDTGDGSVTGTAGFNCGTADLSASQKFANGTMITLTNHPAAGWSLAYWAYAGNLYYTTTFTIALDRDQLVQAVFVQASLPPVVSITNPRNHATNWACQQFYIAATATAQSGVITNLEFFLGSTNGALLASRSANAVTAGAALRWTSTAIGSNYVFVVRATDSAGAQTVSSPVDITIGLPPLNQLSIGISNVECALCLSNVGVHVYSVLATTNLTFWTVLGDMQGSNGYSSYLDPAFTNLPHRFYRAGPQTDLGFYDWAFNTNFAAGVPNSVAITLTNGACSGSSINTGSFYVGFYISSDPSFAAPTLVAEQQVPSGCPANGIMATNWPITLNSPGDYYFAIVIDDFNQVPNCDAEAHFYLFTPVRVQ